jgi:Flp pilus assembly protein TadG
MVETAIVLPIGILLIFGVLQFGVAYTRYQQVAFAASEGARCAAVARQAPTQVPACATAATSGTDAARIAAKKRAGMLNLTDGDITVTTSNSWAFPGTVTVTVTKTQTVPVLGATYTLKAASTARLER